MNPQATHLIFYYPFSFRQYHFEKLQRTLKQHQYFHFQIEQSEFHESLYGSDVVISHDLLTQFFYPFIEEKLLNAETSLVHFNRYSKSFSLLGEMKTKIETIPFTIHSADINLCPFGIGIVAIRVQLHELTDITSALSFAHYFRVLQPKIDEELGATYTVDGIPFENSEQILMKKLAPFLDKFFVDYSYLEKTIDKMPFFEDERMYVSAFMQVDQQVEIDEELLYRAGQLNGRDEDGKPYISSTNEQFIKDFVTEHCYDRWADQFYMMTTLQGHIHLTNYKEKKLAKCISNFHSTTYYTVLIHYFYKLMLLKLAFEHSELKFSKDKDIVEELIEQITKFASRYYFSEVSVRSEGKEITQFFRKVFQLDEKYKEIKETLDELYRVQEDRSADRLNQLLFILTVFSMISGIYGMNLVIEKLGEPISLSSIQGFTLFEWIAFILMVGGLTISIFLIFNQMYNLLSSYFNRRRRKQQQ
ncbi:sugar phosphate isomerase [Lysinibacillus sp. 2017]|uniref:sugar phosphate isomerase n=1 Tax=unclassified Lysinibacillus TaxID=2636778 RepID=UPI000D5278B1|nr:MULTISPECIES: sugar phosphate isomerase [unclassified Lysinibacillus]AWE07497.1 sugar phosphate isomerase [Lysinibacillus sp. 2017]TGN36659.1 sugar phosphate isomerase [Lysinibacillus sp. S2017]